MAKSLSAATGCCFDIRFNQSRDLTLAFSCVTIREIDRQTDRQTETETERDRHRETPECF